MFAISSGIRGTWSLMRSNEARLLSTIANVAIVLCTFAEVDGK